MTPLVFFALITVVGALLLFLGAKTHKFAKVLLILLGTILLLPGVYGLLTVFF